MIVSSLEYKPLLGPNVAAERLDSMTERNENMHNETSNWFMSGRGYDI